MRRMRNKLREDKKLTVRTMLTGSCGSISRRVSSCQPSTSQLILSSKTLRTADGTAVHDLPPQAPMDTDGCSMRMSTSICSSCALRVAQRTCR